MSVEGTLQARPRGDLDAIEGVKKRQEDSRRLDGGLTRPEFVSRARGCDHKTSRICKSFVHAPLQPLFRQFVYTTAQDFF